MRSFTLLFVGIEDSTELLALDLGAQRSRFELFNRSEGTGGYCQLAEEAEIREVLAMDKKTNPSAGQQYPIEILRHARGGAVEFLYPLQLVVEMERSGAFHQADITFGVGNDEAFFRVHSDAEIPNVLVGVVLHPPAIRTASVEVIVLSVMQMLPTYKPVPFLGDDDVSLGHPVVLQTVKVARQVLATSV